MNHRSRTNIARIVTGMAMFALACAEAQVLDLGTGSRAGSFFITGAGATGAAAFPLNDPQGRTSIQGISLTSDGSAAGSFLPGGSLGGFDGFWTAEETFFLPADASRATLNFTLFGDDRVVLQLNGVTVGNFGLGASGPFAGTGLMRLTKGGAHAPFAFNGTDSGAVTTGFNFGGVNTLRLIVNNTARGATGLTRPLEPSADFAFAALKATVTVAAAPAAGDVFVIDPHSPNCCSAVLLRVIPPLGTRVIVSDFSDPSQGPAGGDIRSVAVSPSGDIFVTDMTGVSESGSGRILKIDPVSGQRTVFSDFSAGPGPTGRPVDLIALAGGTLYASTSSPAAVVRIDALGTRTLVSDLSNLSSDAWGLKMQGDGSLVVAMISGGTNPQSIPPSNCAPNCLGAIVRIDPATGQQTMLSDFGNPAQDPAATGGSAPVSLAIESTGAILVGAINGGTCHGGAVNDFCMALYRVNPLTGARTLVSDSDDQSKNPPTLTGLPGQTGGNPYGLAVHSGLGILASDCSVITPAGKFVASLCTVDAVTGQRALLSDFTNPSLGVAGNGPIAIAVAPGPPLVSIAVTPANPSIAKGSTQQFVATGTFNDGSTQNLTSQVTWSSATTSVATITAAGFATAVAGGTSTISASMNGITGSTVLTVVALQSIAVTPANPSIAKGSTQQFTATGTFSDASTQNLTSLVTWNSATIPVASINAAGLATAFSGGTSIITATLGGVTGSTVLTVTGAALQSITVTPPNPSIVRGATLQFNATGNFNDGSTQNLTSLVTWSSSNTAIATIGVTGIARGLQVGGPITITATLGGISASTTLTVVAPPSGVVLAWGQNTFGMLGNGTNTDSGFPVLVSGLTQVIAVAGSVDHSLALKADGSVWAWGANGFGELGNGVNTSSNVPVPVSVLSGVIAISAGSVHSLALKSDGTVWAWGDNSSGQLGNGGNAGSNVPVPVINLTGVVAIAAGRLHNLALKSDGSVWAWGDNSRGQLGTGNNINRTLPALVSGLNGAIAVAAGFFDSMALKLDGTVVAWGQNDDGELGNGSNTNSNLPVAVTGLTGVAAISSGAVHNFALKSDGTVWTWGSNVLGEFGTGNNTSSNVPVHVSTLAAVSSVAGGDGFTLALKPDGTISAWGNNDFGELGNGGNANTNVPAAVANVSGIVAIAGGSTARHSMAITTARVLTSITLTPVSAVVITGNSQQFTATGNYTDGSTQNITNSVTWNSSNTAVSSVNVTGLALGMKPGTTIIRATLGAVSSIAQLTVTAGGTVFGAGEIYFFVKPFAQNVPKEISGLAGVTAVAGGLEDGLALGSDGTVRAWGLNAQGELGNGTNSSSSVPVPVSGLTGVVAIAAGDSHSLALKSDGTVWAWGNNTLGELGTGNNISSNVPVRVTNLIGAVAISTTEGHNLALKSDGTVWAWGDNSLGQLGTGNNIASNLPVPVSKLSGVVAIAAGGALSLALKSDGTVWAWGSNGAGELGNGGNSDSNVPGPVSNLSGVVAISAGLGHCLALKSDGTVWAWGFNGNGELGIGNQTSVSLPVEISTLSGVVAVSAGSAHSEALKSDGTVWAWGSNFFGQLGNASNISTTVPVPMNVTGAVALSGGRQESVTLVIVPSPISIVVTPASANVSLGKSQRYTATGVYSDGSTRDITNQVTWTSSDNSTANIGGAGVAFGAKVGGPVAIRATLALVSSNIASLTIAPAPSGNLWAWGSNFAGELGTGDAQDSAMPVLVSGLASMTGVAAGDFHTLALKSDGTVWSVGLNGSGQLGDATFTNRRTPVQVSGLTNALAVAAGREFSLALIADGTVRAWGTDQLGQLGDSKPGSTSASPVTVNGLTGVIAVAAGDSQSLALRSDGLVFAWGSNASSPVQVAGLVGVIAVAAGTAHSMALKSDGTVWTWGSNQFGQLGNGSPIGTNSLIPVQVSLLSGIVAIASGGSHALALTANGSVWAWGINDFGQLGQGSGFGPTSNVPVQISGLSQVKAIVSGRSHSLALLSDNTLRSWGRNDSGQLGIGSTVDSPDPIPVNLAGVVAIGPGPRAEHTLAISSSPAFHLTTAVSPAAGGLISPPTRGFAPGTTVTIMATAAPGYVFSGFSGALGGTTNPQRLVMNADAAVTSNFAPILPSLSASVGVRSDAAIAGLRNVPITLLNSGMGAATNATITSITGITVVTGSGAVSVFSGTPVNLGSVAPSSSVPSSILFLWPATATRVRFTVNFTADGGYSGSTTITTFR